MKAEGQRKFERQMKNDVKMRTDGKNKGRHIGRLRGNGRRKYKVGEGVGGHTDSFSHFLSI